MKYDTDRLSQISIVEWLKNNGYTKQRGSGKYVSYLSPFGTEANASMKVNTAKNTWRDYHSGKSGNIITLVMELEKCSFVEACRVLGDNRGVDIATYEPVKQESGVKIHLVEDIASQELIGYFTDKRKIDPDVLNKYCKQVSFSFPFSEKDPNAIYTAVGFPTAMKSWELRSSFMKIATPPKSFSKIKGLSNERIILWEGFINFLSFLTYHKTLVPKYTTYILNGVHQIRLVNPFLKGKIVYLYVDSDCAGDGVLAQLDNCTPIDMRYSFAFNNDYNEFLTTLS